MFPLLCFFEEGYQDTSYYILLILTSFPELCASDVVMIRRKALSGALGAFFPKSILNLFYEI
jgi:hypothetical protein